MTTRTTGDKTAIETAQPRHAGRSFFSVRKWTHEFVPSLLLLPSILLLLAFAMFPMFFSLWLSFNTWNLADRTATWTFVGLGNFRTILTTDPFFWPSVQVTLVFVGVTVAIQMILGLAIALLLNDEFRGRGAVRTIIILPLMISPVVVGLIWRFMYNTDRGMVNYLLYLVGLAPVDWLGRQATALPAVMLADIWQWTPFVALILMAALQALPNEPLEAALIDGASRWQLLRYVILPMIRPAVMVALLIRLMDAFKIFDVIYVLTLGGPGVSTQVLGLYTYKWGFKFFQMGYASALSYILVILLIVAGNLVIYLMRRSED